MALQDLTPQLRTRLSRMERAVGWFVLLATGLLVFGFLYYVYHTAERKGWFKTKAPYFTFADRATGLKVGDPVNLMGFDVGQITRIETQPPEDYLHAVYVEFEIVSPYYGYLWTEGSRAKVTTADLLGKRVLEVTKGTGGYPTYIFNPLRTVTLTEAQRLAASSNWQFGQAIFQPDSTNLLARPFSSLTNLAAIAAAGVSELTLLDASVERKTMTGIWHDKLGLYQPYTNGVTKYWLLSDESPAVTERLEKLVSDVEAALPNFLRLTNQLAAVLSNSTDLASNLNSVALAAQPVADHLAAATANLDRPGALGEWLLPTNINHQLDAALTNADAALSNVNTNISLLVEDLARSLDNLAAITSNLNQQVQANTNILRGISDTVIHYDEFVLGLKRHWLLRSAFKPTKTNAPSAVPPQSLSSPKAKGP